MKFAKVNDQRLEARPNLEGECEGCGSRMISKCGDKNVWHWSHYRKRNCDSWWENETEWHRNWKNKFPKEWQEVFHPDGKQWHVADVKTKDGWVLEFQHSAIKKEERDSRNGFYEKLIWVVDGLRRKTDVKQFNKMLSNSTPLTANNSVRRVLFPEECRLINDWLGSPGPVFFDFGEPARVWWLLPLGEDGTVYIAHFSRSELTESLQGLSDEKTSEFSSLVEKLPRLISDYVSSRRALERNQALKMSVARTFRRSVRDRRF